MTLLSTDQILQLIERSAIGTATGVTVGRLLLPLIWRDFKRWSRRK